MSTRPSPVWDLLIRGGFVVILAMAVCIIGELLRRLWQWLI